MPHFAHDADSSKGATRAAKKRTIRSISRSLLFKPQLSPIEERNATGSLLETGAGAAFLLPTDLLLAPQSLGYVPALAVLAPSPSALLDGSGRLDQPTPAGTWNVALSYLAARGADIGSVSGTGGTTLLGGAGLESSGFQLGSSGSLFAAALSAATAAGTLSGVGMSSPDPSGTGVASPPTSPPPPADSPAPAPENTAPAPAPTVPEPAVSPPPPAAPPASTGPAPIATVPASTVTPGPGSVTGGSGVVPTDPNAPPSLADRQSPAAAYFGTLPAGENRDGTAFGPGRATPFGSSDAGYNLRFGVLTGESSPSAADPFNMPGGAATLYSGLGGPPSGAPPLGYNPETIGLGDWARTRAVDSGLFGATGGEWENPIYTAAVGGHHTPFFTLRNADFTAWFTAATGQNLPVGIGSTTFTLTSGTAGATTEVVSDSWVVTTDSAAGTFTLVETVDVTFSRTFASTYEGVSTTTTLAGTDHLVLTASGTYGGGSFTITSFDLTESGTETTGEARARGGATDSFSASLTGSATFQLVGSGRDFGGTLALSSFAITKDGRETYSLAHYRNAGDARETFTAIGSDQFHLDFAGLYVDPPAGSGGESGSMSTGTFASDSAAGSLGVTRLRLHKSGGEEFRLDRSGEPSSTATNALTNTTETSSGSFTSTATGQQTFQVEHAVVAASNGLLRSEYRLDKTGSETFRSADRGAWTQTTVGAEPRQLAHESYTRSTDGSDTFVVHGRRTELRGANLGGPDAALDPAVVVLLGASAVTGSGRLVMSELTTDKSGSESYTLDRTTRLTPGNADSTYTAHTTGSGTFHLRTRDVGADGTVSLASYSIDGLSLAPVASSRVESSGAGRLSSYVLDRTGTETFDVSLSGWSRGGGEESLAVGGDSTLTTFSVARDGSTAFDVHAEEVRVLALGPDRPSDFVMTEHRTLGVGVPTVTISVTDGGAGQVLADVTVGLTGAPAGAGAVHASGFQIHGAGRDYSERYHEASSESFTEHEESTGGGTTTRTNTAGQAETVTTTSSSVQDASGRGTTDTTADRYDTSGSFRLTEFTVAPAAGVSRVTASGRSLDGQLSLTSVTFIASGVRAAESEHDSTTHTASAHVVSDEHEHATGSTDGPYSYRLRSVYGGGDTHLRTVSATAYGDQSSGSFTVTGSGTPGLLDVSRSALDASGSIALEQLWAESSGSESYQTDFETHETKQNADGSPPDVSHGTLSSSWSGTYSGTVAVTEANTSFGYLNHGVDRTFAFARSSDGTDERLDVEGRVALAESESQSAGTQIRHIELDALTHPVEARADGKTWRTTDRTQTVVDGTAHYTGHAVALRANNEASGTFAVYGTDPGPHFRMAEPDGSLTVNGVVNLTRAESAASGPQSYSVSSVGTRVVTGTGSSGLHEDTRVAYDELSSGSGPVAVAVGDVQVNPNFDPTYSTRAPAFAATRVTISGGHTTTQDTAVAGQGSTVTTSRTESGSDVFRMDSLATSVYAGVNTDGYLRTEGVRTNDHSDGVNNYTQTARSFAANGTFEFATETDIDGGLYGRWWEEIAVAGPATTEEFTRTDAGFERTQTAVNGESTSSKTDSAADTAGTRTEVYASTSSGRNDFTQSTAFSARGDAAGSTFRYDLVRTDTGHASDTSDVLTVTDETHPLAGGTFHSREHEIRNNDLSYYTQRSDITYTGQSGSAGGSVTLAHERPDEGHLVVDQSGRATARAAEDTTLESRKTTANGSWSEGTDHFVSTRDSAGTFVAHRRIDVAAGGTPTVAEYSRSRTSEATYAVDHSGTAGWLSLGGPGGTLMTRPGDQEQGERTFATHRSGTQTGSEVERGGQVAGVLSVGSYVRDASGQEDYSHTQAEQNTWHRATDDRGSTDDGSGSFTLTKLSHTTFADHAAGADVGAAFRVSASTAAESGTGFRDRTDQLQKYTHTVKENGLSTEDVGENVLLRSVSNDSFTKFSEGMDVGNTFSVSSYAIAITADTVKTTAVARVRGWFTTDAWANLSGGLSGPSYPTTRDGLATTTLATTGRTRTDQVLTGREENGQLRSSSHSLETGDNTFVLNESTRETWHERTGGGRDDGTSTFTVFATGTNQVYLEADNQSLGTAVSATAGVSRTSGQSNYVRTTSIDKTWYKPKPSPLPAPTGSDTVPYEDGSLVATRTVTGSKEVLSEQAQQEVNDVWSVTDSHSASRVAEVFAESSRQRTHTHDVTSKGSTEDATESVTLGKVGLDRYATEERGRTVGGAFNYTELKRDEEHSEQYQLAKDQDRRWYTVKDEYGSWERGNSTTTIARVDGTSSHRLHREQATGAGVTGGLLITSFVFDQYVREVTTGGHGTGNGTTHIAAPPGGTGTRDTTDTFVTDFSGTQTTVTHMAGRQDAGGTFRAESFAVHKDTTSQSSMHKWSHETYTGGLGSSLGEGAGSLGSVAMPGTAGTSGARGWNKGYVERHATETGALDQRGADAGQGLLLTSTIDRSTDERYRTSQHTSATTDPPAVPPDTTNMAIWTEHSRSGNSLFTMDASGTGVNTLHQVTRGGGGGMSFATSASPAAPGGPVGVPTGPGEVQGIRLEYAQVPTTVESFVLDQRGGESFTIDRTSNESWQVWMGSGNPDMYGNRAGYETTLLHKEGRHAYDLHKEARTVDGRLSVTLMRFTQSGNDTVHQEKNSQKPKGQQIVSMSTATGEVKLHLHTDSTESFRMYQEGADRGETYAHDCFVLDQWYHGTGRVDQDALGTTRIVGAQLQDGNAVPGENPASIDHYQTFAYHADTESTFRLHAEGRTADDRTFVLSQLSVTSSGTESYTKSDRSKYDWYAQKKVDGNWVPTDATASYHAVTEGKNWYDLHSSGHGTAGALLLDSFHLTAGGTESITFTGWAEKDDEPVSPNLLAGFDDPLAYFGAAAPDDEYEEVGPYHSEDSYTLTQDLIVGGAAPPPAGGAGPTVSLSNPTGHDYAFTFDRSFTERARVSNQVVTLSPQATQYSLSSATVDSTLTATVHQAGTMYRTGQTHIDTFRLHQEGEATRERYVYAADLLTQEQRLTEGRSVHSFVSDETKGAEGTVVLWTEGGTDTYTHQVTRPGAEERTDGRSSFALEGAGTRISPTEFRVDSFTYDTDGGLTFHAESSYASGGPSMALSSFSGSGNVTGDEVQSWHLHETGSARPGGGVQVDDFSWHGEANSTWVSEDHTSNATYSHDSTSTSTYSRTEDARGSEQNYTFRLSWEEANKSHSLSTRSDPNDSYRYESDSKSTVSLEEDGHVTPAGTDITRFVFDSSGVSWSEGATHSYTSYSGGSMTSSNTEDTTSRSDASHHARTEGSRVGGVLAVSSFVRERASDTRSDRWTSSAGGSMTSNYHAHDESHSRDRAKGAMAGGVVTLTDYLDSDATSSYSNGSSSGPNFSSSSHSDRANSSSTSGSGTNLTADGSWSWHNSWSSTYDGQTTGDSSGDSGSWSGAGMANVPLIGDPTDSFSAPLRHASGEPGQAGASGPGMGLGLTGRGVRGLYGPSPASGPGSVAARVLDGKDFLHGLAAAPAAVAELTRLAEALKPVLNAVGAKVARGESVNVHEAWGAVQSVLMGGQAKLAQAIYDAVQAGKTTQRDLERWRAGLNIPNIVPVDFTRKQVNKNDMVAVVEDMLASGRPLFAGSLPIYGGGANMNAAQAWNTAVGMSVQVVMLAMAAGMLPMAISGWAAGYAAMSSVSPVLSGAYVGGSIGMGVIGAAWGVASTEFRNPNATNAEKLQAAVLGGVFGFLMPIANLGQVLGGLSGFNEAESRGLSHADAVAAIGKGEVIGSIIGGAAQAGIIGWLGSGRAGTIIVSGRGANVQGYVTQAMAANGRTGLTAAVASLVADIGGAVTGHQLFQAMGLDPWDGANLGMGLVGVASAGLHAARQLKTTRTGQPILDAVKTVLRGGGTDGPSGRWGDLMNLHQQFSSRGNTEGIQALRDGFANAARGWGKDILNQRSMENGCWTRIGMDNGDGTMRWEQSCFAAGTPLLVPGGAKAIDAIRPGDLILSRSEHDPDGAVEPKVVEEVFRRFAPIWHLHVCGQVIRTTGEHPFFARGKGWVPCAALAVGDRLLGHDGQWLPVEDLLDIGEREPVFNMRVADHHTYFVGCAEWGFAAWAHNTCERAQEAGEHATEEGRVRRTGDLNVIPADSKDLSHDIGVQQGREAARDMGLVPEDLWINPREFNGRYGQGFDDVMIDAATGHHVIVEYKGGDAQLAPGQMTRAWVEGNILHLMAEAPWNPLGPQLLAELMAGHLRGVVFSTQRIGGIAGETITTLNVTYPP